MKCELQRAIIKADETDPAKPITLSLDLLLHVAGGLPYNGLSVVAEMAASTSNGPSSDLPYNGL